MSSILMRKRDAILRKSGEPEERQFDLPTGFKIAKVSEVARPEFSSGVL